MTSRPNLISHFEISQLFGLYNYSLDLGKDRAGNQTHQNLLYGDNGTGKTTLLRLMYHALSKKSGDGSRTYMAKVPFKKMSLTLTSGHIISVSKKEELQGSMRIEVHFKSNSESFEMNASPELAVNTENSPDLTRLLKLLSSLKIEQLYLSDDRRIITTLESMLTTDEASLRRRRDIEQFIRRTALPGTLDTLERFDLNVLAERVKNIIRDKLFSSNASLQFNINNIYLNLAKHLASAERPVKADAEHLTDFETRTRSIAARYIPIQSLQVFPTVAFDQLLNVAQNANAKTRSNVIQVLDIYLDTVEAQLDAVSSLAELVNSFVAEMNSYLVNKRITFSVIDGFKVIGSSGRNLSFFELSSGERQLLFLMLVCFVTRDDKSIVYIDEPELSLNIKWQRQLISSLLNVIKDTETQLIIATHSFEILTMHKDSLINLNRQTADAT